MLDWLKTILGDAYTGEIDKKVSDEIGKNFVARSDFNTVNTEKKNLEDTVKDRDKQLDELKKSSGDNAELQAQIKKLQEDNKAASEAHDAEIKNLKVQNAVERALSAAGAKNIKAATALLNDLEKAELAEDGTVKGLDDQIKKLTESEETSFMFDAGKRQFKGFEPGEGGDNGGGGGKKPEDMSYDELCVYLAENPDAKLK